MCKSTAITPGLGNDTHSMRPFHPFLGTQTEIIETGHTFNYVEFDIIKIWIIQSFPNPKKLYSIPIA